MLGLSVGYLLAVCVGVSLGLLGSGGGILALPILVYVMGIPPKTAIAMTLVIVGVASVLALIPQWRRGYVNLKTVFIFGSTTMTGAFLGARIATLPFVSATFQILLFALMMLLAAGLMIYRSSQQQSNQQVSVGEPIMPDPDQYRWIWLLPQGLGIGILTGLVGVGGGFAIVPALVLLGNIPMRQAIGTSLLIIALNAVAGLAGYLGKVTIDWPVTISFTLAASLGVLIGSRLSQLVSVKHLQKGFGYFLLAVAVLVLMQNRSSFQRSQSSTQSFQDKTAFLAAKTN
ncbi:MAG: sulfite exporter TauE/SafE family protein [Leptolyngbyaceae cyanobacterium RM2_2_4]|nr:sulfite exporter TauE/SafE family protein [Leptolyngbyaceae cyanobacterium SM1_4_3]NJO51602.1 sulfite exporter TauE/SafE family protein [Leptolyngbyaceae cyanobacterium RM2_2_4]